jgi:hypothetical protein
MAKPGALAKTSPPPEVPTIESLDAQSVDAFEQAAGGRQNLLAILDAHPGLTKQDRQALLILADPRFDTRKLSKVCGAVGITTGRLYQLYKDARMASAQLAAIDVVASRTRDVAVELLDAAFRRKVVCDVCEGLGQLTRDAVEGQDAPKPRDCPACDGAGVTIEKPTTNDRKLAAEVAGLVAVGGGGVNVQVNASAQANTIVSSDVNGIFSRMQEATDLILYGDPRTRHRHAAPADGAGAGSPTVIDAEAVESVPPDSAGLDEGADERPREHA